MAAPKPIPDDLHRLAAAHGVATSYRNERREPVDVDADVVIKVLGLLEVNAGSAADRRRELARIAESTRVGALPPTVAVRLGGRPHPLPGAAGMAGAGGGQPVHPRPAHRGRIPAS